MEKTPEVTGNLMALRATRHFEQPTEPCTQEAHELQVLQEMLTPDTPLRPIVESESNFLKTVWEGYKHHLSQPQNQP
jgi:hypothetical protein